MRILIARQHGYQTRQSDSVSSVSVIDEERKSNKEGQRRILLTYWNCGLMLGHGYNKYVSEWRAQVNISTRTSGSTRQAEWRGGATEPRWRDTCLTVKET